MKYKPLLYTVYSSPRFLESGHTTLQKAAVHENTPEDPGDNWALGSKASSSLGELSWPVLPAVSSVEWVVFDLYHPVVL